MAKEEKSTNAEVNLRSRFLYKLLLGFLKIIPIVLAGLYLLNATLSYFDIDCATISYLGGMGVIPWLFLMLASYALRFCAWHRAFLWYLAAHNIVCWIDYTFHMLLTDWEYVVLHFIVFGIFLFLAFYLWMKCRKK